MPKLSFSYVAILLIAGLFLSTAPAAPQYPDDPVLRLPFSESSGAQAADTSGNDHVTSLVNGVSWVAGQQGNAIELDGQGGYAVTQATEDLRITGDLTFSLWVRPHAYPSHWTGLLSKKESDTVGELTLRLKNSSTAQLYYGNGSAACVLAWDPSVHLPLSTWTKITGVRDLGAGTLTLYFNGYEGATRSTCGTAAATWSSLLIGKQASTASTFDGLVDEVEIYDRAMTPAEVAWQHTLDQGPTNLVDDSGFEFGTTGPFTGVTRGSLEIDGTLSASGRRSLKHTATGNNSFTLPYVGSSAAVGRAAAGESLQLSVMATAAADTAIQLRIFCLDAAYGNLAAGVGNFTATSAWQPFAVTRTCPTGTRHVSLRLDNDGGAGSIVWWDDLYLTPAVNDASFVSQQVPSTLETGEQTTVTVTVLNSGTSLWTRGQSYRLGAQNPPGNTSWGSPRVDLGAAEVVEPGASYDFTWTISAPDTVGQYDFQWRMVEELVEWFGDTTANVQIDVVDPPGVDTVPPSQLTLALSHQRWEIDGSSTYNIALAAADANSGVQRLEAAVNYQGDNSANPRGRFAWDLDSYAHAADQVECKGEGFASKADDELNPETITLVGCSSQLIGDRRNVVLTVRPKPSFGDLVANDVSMTVTDVASNVSPWTNYDLNFESVVVPNPQGSPSPCDLGYLCHQGGLYFHDANQNPIYVTGSHTWDNLQDWGSSTFNYASYLQMMDLKGHNFMRLWSWQNPRTDATSSDTHPLPWQKLGNCYDLYDGPLDLGVPSSFDPSKVRFDDDYFARLVERVEAADALGIYVDVMLFQGFSVKGDNHPWSYHPFNQQNNCEGIDGNLEVSSTTNGNRFHEVDLDTPSTALEAIVGELQKAYVKKVSDTLWGHRNVLYEIANEDVGSDDNLAWEYAMIDYLQHELEDPHPVGMTSFGFGNPNSELAASGADWISPADGGAAEDYSHGPPVASGSQVILSDNDHLQCILETPNFASSCSWVTWLQRANYRQWVWKSLTRGHNVILMDAVQHAIPGLAVGSYPAIDPDNPAFPYVRDYLGHAAHFANRIDLSLAGPETETCSTDYCLVDPGVTYLVYQPAAGSFTVELLPGVYEVEWFNPHGLSTPTEMDDPIGPTIAEHTVMGADVTVSTLSDVTFHRPGTFGCEGSGQLYECDAVLLLTVSPTSPPPPPPSSVSATYGTLVGQVVVSWTSVADATSYEVWRHTEDETAAATRIGAAVTSTSYSDTTAMVGTEFYYWVRSRNAAGVGDFSSPALGMVNSDADLAIFRGWNGVEASEGSQVDLPPAVEGFPQTYRLTLENQGPGPLVIDNPAALLASHPCIQQVASIDASLDSGESTDLDLVADCDEGLHTVAVAVDSNDPDEDPFELTLRLQVTAAPTCIEDAHHLCLQNGRFRVGSTFIDPFTGALQTAHAVPYTGSEQSGFFWFFGANNLETVVKVLDGTTINDSFWVFHGGATHVEYSLHVEDILTGDTYDTTKAFGSFCGGFDIDAFPQGSSANVGGGSAAAVKGSSSGWLPMVPSLLDGPATGSGADKAGTCVPGDTTLCFHDNRFAIEVDWVDHQGNAGQGHAIPMTLETGLFWYFGPGNLELMIKILDGRSITGHWWVFYASLSQVEFTIRVTDTEAGNVATYFNPSGTYCGNGDTSALPGP